MERPHAKLVNFASIIDEPTLHQAFTTAKLGIVQPHLALMPDAHLGLGATVGSVIPTVESIIPAAVGVDIGCGMIAVRVDLKKSDTAGLDRSVVRRAIERAVPLSAGGHNKKVARTAAPRVGELEDLARGSGFDPSSYTKNWRLQLGSLGSGNHFIELAEDENDNVWLFLHSGSRGVGNRIAQHHIRVAQSWARTHRVDLPNRDLAYLEEGTGEFDRYIAELRWAQRFASLNREEMMDRVLRQVQEWVGRPLEPLERIACHHNYTEREEHFGREVWISRKGAIDAHVGVMGLIPGSMGDKSYVVEGRGNPEALMSAPHGAGRALSRSEARRRFTHDDLRAAMGPDVEYRDTAQFIDEIPQAYKPIDQVMRDADSLVAIRHTLRQFVNVKGD